MKLVGLVTDRENRKLSDSDRLLIEPLKKYGFEAEPAVWEDKKTDWGKYDYLIIRSCWNYYHHYDQWLQWLEVLMNLGVKVYNPIDILKWNSYKSYLLDLEQKGVKIIPTKIAKAGEIISGENLIIKPLVGASSTGVKLIPKAKKYKVKHDSLIQPKIEEINAGELSLIFVNKEFLFGVNKQPKDGDYRTHPKFGGREEVVKIPNDLKRQAGSILELISAPLLYARVDGVVKENQFLLMELELIEPHLFLDLFPPAAEVMAKAIYEFS